MEISFIAILVIVAVVSWAVGVKMGARYATKRFVEEIGR